MARIRSLKIGFFHNEELCELSFAHRLLFEGLWLLADREGRLEDRPKRIKAQLFPYDDLDVDVLLTDLARRGFVQRYDADGAPAIAVLGFLKHQRPNVREAASAIPAPTSEKSSVLHVQGQGEWDLGSGLGNGLGKGADADAAPLERPDDLMASWNAVTQPPIPRCRELTPKRIVHARARLQERLLSAWVEIFGRIQASAFCRGENDRGWTATFDWIIGSSDPGVKVLEGKYDDRRKAGPRPVATASPIGRREIQPMGITEVGK